MSYRIVVIYVIPVWLLVSILAWLDAGLKNSVFALPLGRYGHGVPQRAILITVSGCWAHFNFRRRLQAAGFPLEKMAFVRLAFPISPSSPLGKSPARACIRV